MRNGYLPDMPFLLAMSLIFLAFVIGLWDVWHVFIGWPTETVSWIIQEWSMRWPLFPFLIGVLIGHLLWPVKGPVTPP